MKSLNTLWSRYMDIALGAPEVVARRLAWFGEASPWTPERLWEAQRMVWEKAGAASRAWWAMYAAGLPLLVPPPVGRVDPRRSAAVVLRETRRRGEHVTRAASQALQPFSSTVSQNVRRLRKRKA
jgi:hypothetical protein